MKCEADCSCGRHSNQGNPFPTPQPRELHPAWKGSSIGKRAMHQRVVSVKGKARDLDCVDCGGPALDWSQTHDTDPLLVDSYEPRCRRCHGKYDSPNKGKTWSKARREAQDARN